jgi:hypothetical protein
VRTEQTQSCQREMTNKGRHARMLC